MTWYQSLGFYSNPFSIKPAAFHDELFGYEGAVEEISKKIAQGSVLLLTGEYGSGKTTVLKRIINSFRGQKDVIYYSCNEREKSIDFDALLSGMTFFRRLLGIRKTGTILLLDEAQEMSRKDADNAASYFHKGYFKSIVLVSHQQADLLLTSSLRELLKDNFFRLNKLDRKSAIALVRKRIGNLQFLPDDIIEKVYAANSNPRQLLRNCEAVCRRAAEDNADRVLVKHVKDILD